MAWYSEPPRNDVERALLAARDAPTAGNFDKLAAAIHNQRDSILGAVRKLEKAMHDSGKGTE